MSLLTALKKSLDQSWNVSNSKFGLRESSYQVRQILALFCKLVALIFG